MRRPEFLGTFGILGYFKVMRLFFQNVEARFKPSDCEHLFGCPGNRAVLKVVFSLPTELRATNTTKKF